MESLHVGRRLISEEIANPGAEESVAELVLMMTETSPKLVPLGICVVARGE